MKHGHPYLTTSLDDERVEQRRILREMPGWVIDRIEVSPLPPLPEDKTDRALSETMVREEARSRIEPVKDLLTGFREHTKRLAFAQWVSSAPSTGQRFQAVEDEAVTASERAEVRGYPIEKGPTWSALSRSSSGLTRWPVTTRIVWTDRDRAAR